jgi:nitrogen fixation-related uncharacterized protein
MLTPFLMVLIPALVAFAIGVIIAWFIWGVRSSNA